MNISFLHSQLFLFNNTEPIRQSMLLTTLANGLEDADVLLKTLRGLAMEASGTWGGKLAQLIYLLEDGSTLSEAAIAVPGLFPERSVLAIRAAEPAGALRQVLADEAAAITENLSADGSQPSFVRFVFVTGVLFYVIATVLMFLMVWVVPRFRDIFEGFGVELPAGTMLLIDLANVVYEFWYLFVLPIATFLLYFVGLSLWSRWKFLTRGQIPFTNRWSRFWTPQILRSLSVSVAARQSLPETLHLFQAEMPPGRAATALSRVRNGVESGESPWPLLQQGGFLKKQEALVLESAEKADHLDWALHHAATEIERRRSSRLRAIVSVLQPLLMMLIGIVVLFIIVSLYLPLAKLGAEDFSTGI